MDLKKYCSKDQTKYSIAEPFTQDGISWATNGWMIIGIPALPEVPVNPKAPNISRVAPNTEPQEWFDIPEVEVTPCKTCEGVINNFKCPECYGSGAVTLKNDFTVYEGIECGSCDGDGEVPFCKHCYGTGVDASGMITIGAAQFKANALYLIKNLPGIQISPTGEYTPAYLRFDGGGVGFLMPGKDHNK